MASIYVNDIVKYMPLAWVWYIWFQFTLKGGLSMADVAYCVKCKEKREMKDPHKIEMKNGKPAMQGTCSVCGTKLTRILSSKDA
jgi:hypothetical protein